MSFGLITYSIIVPVYNEELVIDETYRRLKKVMDTTGESYEVVFVNDGSIDKTLEKVIKLQQTDKCVKLINFSRNFGHQAAITAGIVNSSGRAVIVIDADLQDPPEIIQKMIEKWKDGYDVIYGRRLKRKGETLFKRITAKVFYRTLESLTDVDIPLNTGDYRLIDRRVCNALKMLPEKNRYVRGLISWLGFNQTGIEFIREERFAGNTKYPLKKMIKLGLDGIISFSYKPLKLATYIGVILSLLSFIYLIIVIIQRLFTNTTIVGWTSLIAISLLFNGVILIILGIIGEYIGRIYDEVKGRPLYIISDKTGFEEEYDKSEKYT